MAAKVVKKSETTKHFLFFYLFIYYNYPRWILLALSLRCIALEGRHNIG